MVQREHYTKKNTQTQNHRAMYSLMRSSSVAAEARTSAFKVFISATHRSKSLSFTALYHSHEVVSVQSFVHAKDTELQIHAHASQKSSQCALNTHNLAFL